MKLLPGIEYNNLDYDLTKSQAITIAVISYFSIAAYSFLLTFECHNVYFFLYRQRKYKVYPVALFYAFAIPCSITRIWVNCDIVRMVAFLNPLLEFVLADLKICIGLTQILVMIELNIRLRQTLELFK